MRDPRVRTLQAVLLVAATVALVLLPSRTASAISDPDLEWYTIETPHFIIHYHSGLEEMAADTARLSEDAHELLSPLLDWTPSVKTQVVLTDVGDSANGSARVTPLNLVRLFGATPSVRGALADYDDWLRSLIYHEYVHILHLDTMYGPAAWINAVFGKLVAPNGSLPRWFTEGLATYYESSRTEGGRVRNSSFKMSLRAQALEESFFDIAQISANPTAHPGVRAWYQHGSHFVAFVANRFGEQSLTDYNHIYGARIVPFGLNIVARKVWGEDLPSLYRKWHAAELGEAMSTWVRVRARGGPTDVNKITELTYQHDHVRPRPGHNSIAYVHSDGRSDRRIVLYDPETGEESFLRETHGPGRVAWSPDGEWFVVAENRFIDRFYVYQDLIRVNADTDETERLTVGQRAREPAVSPDGQRVVFSAQREGTSDLTILDVETGDLEIVHRGHGREQHATPTWFPDSRRIVVSRFTGEPNGQRDLWIYDTKDGSWTRITDDRALDLEPDVHPSGRWVVFASDRNGIYDIHLYDVTTGRTHRLTRMVTGAFSPRFSQDGQRLYMTVFAAHGFDVGWIDTSELDPSTLEVAPDDRRPVDFIDYTDRELDLDPEPYAPWRYLFPRTWLPEFIANIGFDDELAMSIGGSDPVGHHAWLARVAYNLDADEWGGAFTYLYSRLPVNLQLRASRNVINRGFRGTDGQERYDEERVRVALDVNAPFPSIDESHSINASFQVQRFALAEPIELDHDPLGRAPNYPELGWFNLARIGWSFADVEAYQYSISTEQGYILSAAATFRSPIIGADVSSFDLSWAGRLYIPIPWPWHWLDNHVLAMRYSGGIGWADFGRRGLFVIGGIPDQDIAQSLIDGFGIGGAALRGYPPLATFGDQFHLSNAEYRFPIHDFEEGYSTLPLFIDQLHAALFADYGAAFFGEFDFEKLRLGVGGELRLRFLLGYGLPYMMRLGYAFGADEDGLHHIYAALGSQF